MATAVYGTASALLFTGPCILVSVTVTGGADAAVINVRDGTTAAGAIVLVVKAGIAGMTQWASAGGGIDLSSGLYVEVASGTTPAVTVEIA